MSCEDLQLEDIVLLQLFKDQILNCGLDQGRVSTERFPGQQADFSDIEKILSEPKPSTGVGSSVWPEAPEQGSSARKADTALPRDLPGRRQHRAGSQTSSVVRARRLGKDEKLAKEAGITFNVKQTLIALPMDEFNDLLSKNTLTEEQLNICRDIRRRGKNKVAAQNCRQRKLEQIEDLQGRLARSLQRRDKVRWEHQRLLSVYAGEAEKLRSLTEVVLAHHSKDTTTWSVQVVGEEVMVLPKTEIKEEDIVPQPAGRYCPEAHPWPAYSSPMEATCPQPSHFSCSQSM